MPEGALQEDLNESFISRETTTEKERGKKRRNTERDPKDAGEGNAAGNQDFEF